MFYFGLIHPQNTDIIHFSRRLLRFTVTCQTITNLVWCDGLGLLADHSGGSLIVTHISLLSIQQDLPDSQLN